MEGKMRKSEASTSHNRNNNNNNNRGETVVVDWGRRRSSCGYCQSAGRTSISHGLWADSVTVDDYQDLLDRGWRRSGCFLYKPEMERTCCPSYTIRLKASDFIASKEQLRVLRKMQRFLDGSLNVQNSGEATDESDTIKATCSCASHSANNAATYGSTSGKIEWKGGAEDFSDYLAAQIDNVIRTCNEQGELPSNMTLLKASVKRVSLAKSKLLAEGTEELLYSSNIAFQIAANIKRAQSSEKDATQSAGDGNLSSKTIAEKIANALHHVSETNGILIRAGNGHINFYAPGTQAASSSSTKTVAGYEESVTSCKRKDCCLRKASKHPQGKRQRLEIHLKRSSFDPEEFELYRRYQMIVHNDNPDHVTESSYRRFLVDTPLVPVSPSGDGRVPSCGFGSFHQQYLINGRLFAVGVMDILPKCLSSKYLFWDPDFAFLSPGKYSALQEIGWVKDNQLHCPSLQYYYLGYYIHSCSKMRYKAAYRPSELLCPLRYQWVSFEIARPLLDRKPYVVLSDSSLLQNGESFLHVPENEVGELHNDNGDENRNDPAMDEDEEMIESEFESSDDELDPEMGDQTPNELGNEDLGGTLIGISGSRFRYKDVQRAFGNSERNYLEAQLRRYKRVVGAELSERIVYSLR
ncbi:hypothetical protein K2173_005024 [Erythroxylum novogranatense]|uniref:Arginyl-tRNA--protein transferase n=1 Tax=Erythroxylum novogranatense TaxID=1862640 RepID=A0AAV8TDC4_9ROSI|nr:hypothetical protein K2173_005024 [Erythroxylum novogranatense]